LLLSLPLWLAPCASRAAERPLAEFANGAELAGRLALDTPRLARWAWAGAWLYPVGDRFDYRESRDGAPGYLLLRGVERREDGTVMHQGADLGNRRGGDLVHAAATGLVAYVGWQEGYGWHVVLAHRLPEGAVAYTVYAHLRKGTIRVKRGAQVGADAPLARVGQSGRATTPHLHFEVRLPGDVTERWEKTEVVDPLEFVAARLAPAPDADDWDAPYALAGRCAGLVPRERPLDERLTRDAWWKVLARAARHSRDDVPEDPEQVRDLLVEMALLPDGDHDRSTGDVDWPEFARDLGRLHAAGSRLPRVEVTATALHALCERHFGVAEPAARPARLAKRDGPGPTLAEALLAVAEPRPAPRIHRAKKVRPTP
jgi:hypothetical protein